MNTDNLVQTIQRLSRCRDLSEVISVLRQTVRALTGADGVTVVLREGEFCHYAEEDAVGPLWKGRRFPLSACISGWCMLNRQQVTVPDIYADPRIPHDSYRPTFVKSLIMTPIRSEAPIGAIGAYWAREHAGSDRERDILQALADSASVAIANAELIASLEQSNRSKDEFITMLAHELRNPLTPIWNAAYVLRLQSKAEDATAERAYAAVERQMRHLTRLVDDLVDGARLARGQVALQVERADLAAATRDTTEDWRAAIETAGLSLTLELPVRPVMVDIDTTRFAQVLGNLLDNARKYTPVGGEINVRVQSDPVSHRATLTVRDTGSGIASEDLPHIFESFAQADRSLDRSLGGLGLGLSIARGVLQLHGGTLRAESEGPGRGAQFTVELPLADVPSPVVEEKGAPLNPQPDPARVLIVEDNYDSADTLRLYLEHLGYDVTVAGTGPDGVTRAKEKRPDVILCDIGLPGLDGYGVAEHVRADPATRNARLIAITGYGSDEARARALQAGFDVHLVKPVDLRGLTAHFGRSAA